MPFVPSRRHFILLATALVVAVATSVAQAEYRVFVLAITDTASGQVRTVTDTLDDIQYAGYHNVRKTETVTIADTWMCWGRQGEFQKPCPNPREPASTTPPAAGPSTSSGSSAPGAAPPP